MNRRREFPSEIDDIYFKKKAESRGKLVWQLIDLSDFEFSQIFFLVTLRK
jgi:hypothetical protein